MRIRSKFTVSEVADVRYSPAEAKSRIRVVMSAVYATGAPEAEDVSFAKATPSGKIELTVDNEAAFAFFEPGRQVYVDMTLAPRSCSQCHGGGVIWPNQPGNTTLTKITCPRCSGGGIDPVQT